jgi:ParB family transcriptional regulator, chromosome partitioning protein
MTMTADKAAQVAEKAAGEKAPGEAEQARVEKPAVAHDKRRALGRGLESLLPGPRAIGTATPGASSTAPGWTPAIGGTPTASTAAGAGAPVSGMIAELLGQAAKRKPEDHEVIDLSIAQIDMNPHQTRSFTKSEVASLEELRDSIGVQGVIQPVTVRPGKEGRFTLITGERRVRASQMAGKSTVPAIVRIVSEQQAAEMTVIENLQRRDLNCIDLARAFIMLSKDFGLTQEQIGQRVGSARESVSNYMRLARLPLPVQQYLQDGQLEFSHARVLLNLEDAAVQERVAHKAVREDWSVDKLEHFVLFDPSMFGAQKKVAKGGGARWVDPNVRAAQRELETILGVKVRIRDRKGKGKITLEYSTIEDYDRVLAMLKGH